MQERTPVVVKEVEIPEATKRAQVILERINKAVPEGLSLMSGAIPDIPVIPTGCLSIDKALGVGGMPHGRIVEVYGPESSGKTTLCLHVAAECQKAGGLCAFIDVEHALDMSYASRLGVQVGELLVSQPDYGEQALEIADMLCEDLKHGDMIVVDSVAALVPKAELDGEMIDQQMGLQARLMSKAMRKLKGKLNRAGVLCMFVNQIRENIGVTWGSATTTPGGKALKFYSSVRLEVKRIGAIKKGDVVIANRTKAVVKKNKVAPPFREAEFDIRFGEGIDKKSDVLDLAIAFGVAQKAGSWYNYGDTRLGQGRENALIFLKEYPAIFQEIESTTREKINDS